MDSKEHHLTAILFSDIVGYSALMNKDEDAAWQVLQKAKKIHLELIERYNGEMLKELGDGFLICFSSVIDAVHCAKDLILETTKEELLSLSVGIHLGDVITREGDVFGDGVNIAARLQQEANENEVLISESVFLNIKNQTDIGTDFIGKIELKNIDGPITVYKLKDGRTHRRQKKVSRKAIINTGVILIMLILAYMFAKLQDTENKITERTIAVLPFENLSDDPDQEYFSDGVSDEIRIKLGYIKGLSVRGRSSSMYFKGRSRTLKEISDVLNVNYVLEGSVRNFDNKAYFNLSLVDTRNDVVVLPIQIEDQDLGDIYMVQADIAKMVAQKLEATLLPEEERRVEKIPTGNLEAHRYYLLGRYHYMQGQSRENIYLCLDYLDKAIGLDSSFADAYAMKALVMGSWTGWGYQSSDSVVMLTKPLVDRALYLDPELSEAYLAIGNIYNQQGDYSSAFVEFKKAMELDPSNDLIFSGFGQIFMNTQQFELALKFLKKAGEINPFSQIGDAQIGLAYYNLGELDSAILHLENNLVRWPDNDWAKWIMAGCYNSKGEYEKAVDLYLSRSVATKNLNFALGYTYAGMGEIDSARKVLSYLIDKSENDYVPPSQIGLIYFGLGNKDSTFYWMEKAHRTKDWNIPRLVPLFDSLLTQSPYKEWFDFGDLDEKFLDF